MALPKKQVFRPRPGPTDSETLGPEILILRLLQATLLEHWLETHCPTPHLSESLRSQQVRANTNHVCLIEALGFSLITWHGPPFSFVFCQVLPISISEVLFNGSQLQSVLFLPVPVQPSPHRGPLCPLISLLPQCQAPRPG